ncbi:hypothetical protein RclHR1_03520020 [Rhizophagus clarus]|uniref:Uncharacterized protein n=1 Tax=Rhizophagus clarus TaxID=94130 RepID=A0A2Z6RBX2_9GLOM|nr:hypothetical protein RclHR1_03520020 [Rhizophagus clarus]
MSFDLCPNFVCSPLTEVPLNKDSTNKPSLNILTNPQKPILRNIANTKTRWNSKYHSWNRLLKLHKAIEWLGATLPLSDNHNDRTDGRKFKKQLLLSHEWSLLKQIVNLLEPFEDATTYFSGTSYTTLSIIYPLIQVLKFKYAENNDNNDDDSEIEQDAPNFQHEESDEESELSDSDEDNPELDTPEQSTSYHHQTRSKTAASIIQPAQDILKIMKKTIYNSLFVYWNEPIMISLLALLLDPQLETLSNWDEEKRKKTKKN